MQSKKQLFEVIESIAKLNSTAWDNQPGSYVDEEEAAYQIEEALEGFDDLGSLAFELNYRGIANPKELSRQIVDAATLDTGSSNLADVDRFDKALDAIYFAIGSMHKLGLLPRHMVEGLQVVHNANLQKVGVKDSAGKVTKPDNFQNPEPKLQAILDRRP